MGTAPPRAAIFMLGRRPHARRPPAHGPETLPADPFLGRPRPSSCTPSTKDEGHARSYAPADPRAEAFLTTRPWLARFANRPEATSSARPQRTLPLRIVQEVQALLRRRSRHQRSRPRDVSVRCPADDASASTPATSRRLVHLSHGRTSVSYGALSHCMFERLIRVQELRSSIRRQQTRNGVGVEHSFRCDRDVRVGHADETRILK